MRTFRRLVPLLLTVTVALPGVAPTSLHGQSLADLSRSLQGITEQVVPGIIQVFTVGYGAPDPRQGAVLAIGERTGSGVMISPDGYIVTNAHVVEGARTIGVLMSEPAVPGTGATSIVKPVGLRLSATLVGVDVETDLAVLKVDVTDHAYLEFGDSDDLRAGQMVLAFGAPLGLQNSVTMGIVSAVGRQLNPDDRMVYIQTDAPVNPGNSGGPLINTLGQVVGINTLILSQSGGSEGLGFAAPSNIVRYVSDEIREHGRVRRGQIGVFAQTITPDMAEGLRLVLEWGVIIADVFEGGTGQRAGLQPGDIVVSLNGKPMENGRQFDVNLYRKPIGQPVSLEVRRGLERLTVSVTVAERADDPSRLADMVTRDENLIERLGVLVIKLDRTLASALPWLRDPVGLVVAAQAPGAPRRRDGLMPGDVIYSLNGEEARTIGALRSAVGGLRSGDAAVFHVNRRGRRYYVAFVMD
jgi:serine protease Do